MTFSGKTCRVCRVYQPSEQEGQGECRLKSPTVFLIASEMGRPKPVAAFPPVHASHWCGEYQPALLDS